MLIYKKGDILSEKEGLIVHGCNTRGAFGSGLAGQIRKRFPIVYEAYTKHPMGKEQLGNLQKVEINDRLWFGNGFTQSNFGSDGHRYADPSAIFAVLDKACAISVLENKPLKTVKLGCGLGGLDWENDVKPVFDLIMDMWHQVDIEIFEP